MGGREAAKDNVEGLSAVDGAKAYRQGLSLCGDGFYEKALLVRQNKCLLSVDRYRVWEVQWVSLLCDIPCKTCKRWLGSGSCMFRCFNEWLACGTRNANRACSSA